jgi:hypothetical protein
MVEVNEMKGYERIQEELRIKEERVQYFEMYGVLPEQAEVYD